MLSGSFNVSKTSFVHSAAAFWLKIQEHPSLLADLQLPTLTDLGGYYLFWSPPPHPTTQLSKPPLELLNTSIKHDEVQAASEVPQSKSDSLQSMLQNTAFNFAGISRCLAWPGITAGMLISAATAWMVAFSETSLNCALVLWAFALIRKATILCSSPVLVIPEEGIWRDCYLKWLLGSTVANPSNTLLRNMCIYTDRFAYGLAY